MTLLPIVMRELAMATRKAGNFWFRFCAALAACVVAGFLIFDLARGAFPGGVGNRLFSWLSELALTACLAAGVFLSADAISSEKREGTLGLLFLTDLRGYDVVLGKLTVAALCGCYGLLAILPVMAVPLMLGGVSLGQVLRVVLALFVALFLSVSLGILISSANRKEQPAMAQTALVLAALAYLLPRLGPQYRWMSPSQLLHLAASPGSNLELEWFYWSSLGQWGGGCFLIGLTCWWTPRSWKDRVIHPVAALPEASPGEREVRTEEPPPRERRPVGDDNPVCWLIQRQARQPVVIWAALSMAGLAWLMTFPMLARSSGGSASVLIPGMVFHVVLKFFIAWEASRRFVEDRKNGTLEMLLSTPMTVPELIRGHWDYLVQRFSKPVLAVAAMDFALVVTRLSSPAPVGGTDRIVLEILALLGMFLADAVALAWLGLWESAHCRRSSEAASKTVAHILLLPSGLLGLVVFGTVAFSSDILSPVRWLLGFWLLIGGVNDLFWIVLARHKLRGQLREKAVLA
jgi:ABC-2 family transporter protein